ncbi:MAG: MBL fold metallo-hydrolase [Candidatus Pacearchaeota archaeon]
MINQISSNTYQLYFNEFGSCVYLLKLKKEDKQQNILIDTSSKDNEQELINNLRQLSINPEDINIILLTHSHWDHIGNIKLFENAKLYDYNNKNEMSKDFPEIKVIETPGHTKDSLCFLYKDILFSGDTLFHNGIGKTDFKESLPNKMQSSLNKLKNLKYKILCPGHV